MTNLDIFSDFSDKDLPNIRSIKLMNGHLLNLKRTDPFGFWRVSLDKGNLPKHLSEGVFTSVEEAMKQVKVYLQNKGWHIKNY